jgi:predicted nucleic acid-binding protein
MLRKWVVDASPLIVLARIGHVSLLEELCDEVIIPTGVSAEIDQGPDNDPAKV